MRARQVSVRGKKTWVVPLGKREVGKRVHVFGSTKEEALARAVEKRDELRAHGHELAGISASHRGLIIEWRERLSVEEMGHAFRKFVAARGTSKTVEEARAEYVVANKLEKRTRRGGAPIDMQAPSRQHASDIRYRLRKFSDAFPGRTLDSIIPGELESFFSSQGASARNFHKALHAFFGYARRQRWIAVDPFVEIQRPAGNSNGEKAIFKASQMKQLLKAAAGMMQGCERHEPSLALLVLGGLCGLRYSEALRLRWEQVDMVSGEIHLTQLKTSKRGLRSRFVKLLPAAAGWLATLARDPSGRVVCVNDKNARRHRARILKAAKLTAWPDNVLRRSWGSYHLAAYENADLTAAQMGHTSAETTFAKYRTLARKSEGEAWFSLTPAKVEEVDNVIEFAPRAAAV